MNLNHLFIGVPVSSVIALFFAYFFYLKTKKEDAGTKEMQEIAEAVRQGAKAYLRQQYKIVAIFFAIVAAVFAVLAYVLKVQNEWVPFAFITGGFFSGLAGYFGMNSATIASVRSTQAATKSLDGALKVAFRSGAVMGLTVVGLGLLDIAIWFSVLFYVLEKDLATVTTIMLSFGIGASTQALFARVGGGIFTKAADVGADLVGKVEAGIPEDDPRNPAVIADNVGDNVGDVAGMGADLYESYCGSILATAALGAAAFMGDFQLKSVLLPMFIAAFGIIASIIGIFFVRTKEGATQKQLMNSLNTGVLVASVIVIAGSFGIVKMLLPGNMGIFWAIIIGLVVGIIIGKATEYYTSYDYKPTKNVASSAQTGHATVIISGIGIGMVSTAIPVLTVVVGILLSYYISGGSTSITMGLYGVAIAAVGMLSTLGITLATDAYGPIADNAGGNAEMSKLPHEVRQRTDSLDSLGNTTAAVGKGFAIGSAALTALALLAAYVEEIKHALIHFEKVLEINVNGNIIPTASANIEDFMVYYGVTLTNPLVLSGLFIGAMLAFAFSGMTMNAVGRAAQKMVDEVRRQFKEIPGIMEGTGKPDYASCVGISTKAAQKEMLVPSILAVVSPIIVGVILGVPGVLGLLSGALTTGFILAVFMANSGGSWDNAKKYIETGMYGGKGQAAHKAAVTGDTVGDPFKDTSGPSLNILIKLMSMVSVVVVGVVLAYSIMGKPVDQSKKQQKQTVEITQTAEQK